MKKSIFITSLLLYATSASTATAQEALATSGGNGSGSGGSNSYTVGQVAYTYSNDGNYSISDGVQQAYEVSQISGIQDHKIELSVTTYPNPTTDFLTLSFQELPAGEISFDLLDASGKLIRTENVYSVESKINLKEQPVGLYYLVLRINNKQNSAYKIVKN